MPIRPHDGPGRRTQIIGGAVAALIGILGLLRGMHKRGWAFLVVGIVDLVLGTLDRPSYLD